tara:strand:- start:222 stop:323 length:102 start_codon:yes stop_codon:yes gene_type:complete
VNEGILEEVIKNKEAFIKHLVSNDKKQVQPKLI